MISIKDAELLAQNAMQAYVNKCNCKTQEDVANVLMKLTSMCGLGMCAAVGQKEAVDRLMDATNYLAKTQAGVHWKCERAH